MMLEKGKISSSQFVFSVACFIQGATLLTGFIMGTTKQDTWIAVIAAYVTMLPILLLYMFFIKLYPGKTIIEVYEEVFGRVIGKFLSAVTIIFILSHAWLNTMEVSSFFATFLMPETPTLAFSVMFLFVCGWAVSKGVETLTRYSFLLASTTFVVIISNGLFLLDNIHLSNFLPIFYLPITKYVQSVHTIDAIPFEMFALLFIVPSVKDSQNIEKSFVKGLSLGALTLLIIVFRDTAVLGPIAATSSLPSLETVRLIDIGHAITRVEIIYSLFLTFLHFFRISLTYYAATVGIAQLFNLRTYKPLVPVVGVILAVMSVTSFNNSMESANWGKNLAAFYSSFFEVGIPLLALFAALFKKFDNQKGANKCQ